MEETITAEMMKRRVIFDCMEDPVRIGLLAGLVGVSEEGAEKEEEASMERMVAVAPLFPFLSQIAEWVSQAATILNLDGVTDVPPYFPSLMEQMICTAVEAALMSAFSVLNDLDAIEINYKG